MSEIDQEQIRERAYALWERAGCPDGEEERFWLEAEHELSGDHWQDAIVPNSRIDHPSQQSGPTAH